MLIKVHPRLKNKDDHAHAKTKGKIKSLFAISAIGSTLTIICIYVN
jgi:hypothetical protein